MCVCPVRACVSVLEFKQAIRRRAFVRPPIIQSSTPPVPVALHRRNGMELCCCAGTFFEAWLLPAFDLLHAFNVKHKQSTFDHHWFDGCVRWCVRVCMCLYFYFSLSAFYRFRLSSGIVMIWKIAHAFMWKLCRMTWESFGS